MFQTFESRSEPGKGGVRLKALRAEMAREGMDWYLVPHADEHQNEYLPDCAERLAWLTGFTGSAGFALIGKSRAFVFADGRYTVQLRAQIDSAAYEPADLVNEPPAEFIAGHARRGETVGFDPMLMTLRERGAWNKACKAAGLSLKPADNLVDRIWTDRPSPPLGRAFLHPLQFAGRDTAGKLEDIRKAVRKAGADLLVMTDPAAIAWTFNLRGSDVVHNPLALAFAIVPAEADDRPLIFIDRRKLDEETADWLAFHAEPRPPADFLETLAALAHDRAVHCDPALVSVAIGDAIEGAGGRIVRERDPVVLLRAIKNEAELAGSRSAHLRDGVAMVRFLAWLDRQEPGTVNEIGAAMQLEKQRAGTATAMNSQLREIAFDTISGAGPNGAIVHYRVTRETNRLLEDGTLFLVDSGGQYPDGTTDITRTIAIGEPPAEARTDFTLVLRGHIAIATARFPEGTRGIDLDPLARQALWQHGRDYAHGTGHGVGSFLNVHEGPQSISKRGMEPLKPGMILSNEPGFYREGRWGIRIENLVVVRAAEPVPGGDRPVHSFENLTLCPIDSRLIDPALMREDEIAWLDSYHQWVREELSGFLDDQDRQWLEAATRPLA